MTVRIKLDVDMRKFIFDEIINNELRTGAEVILWVKNNFNARLHAGPNGWETISFRRNRDYTFFVLKMKC